ncbi:succinyl-CoA synthetase-like protein [Daldinia caldariorum]|uniref:succinyl-CoA synthetase-like protein n=1 Tax=Daldinia caldariorum TaxID=326644 RepID=UPI00200783C7|nr:succinyl-CoA synthetase-like protein [Daldinia caldariorum]KAI1467450.1 succinyl-CoA synthetase-like protein [Daldinia caldariorum]
MLRTVPRSRTWKYISSRNLGSRQTLFQNHRNLSSSSEYDSTLKNLKIGSHTRVIFQGFTGRQATANACESIEWGTNILGGVTPGREGEHLGLPVFPTVRKAAEVLKPDATGIYVAAHQAAGAIEEAIEAGVPLIVAVAEHIPLHDILRIHSILKTQSKCRLIGANSPGIISAVGKCRIGFQPLPCFEPGRIGIVARSGTLSYETAASTLRSGLGQSMCIGVGGDILPGTSLMDGLKILAEDKDTEGIAVIGEIGGEAELEAADWIREYRTTTENPKPMAALVAGVNAVPGRLMGHAGAFTLPGEPSPLDKIEALKAAGTAIVNHPSRFGPVLKSMLEGVTPTGSGVSPSLNGSQRRGIHSIVHRPVPSQHATRHLPRNQKRNIYLSSDAALNLLRQHGVPIASGFSTGPQKLLAISIDRSAKTPCIIASPTGDTSQAAKFAFEPIPTSAILQHLNFDSASSTSLHTLLTTLSSLFTSKEAFLLETLVSVSPSAGTTIHVSSARFGFDDAAAFRSCVRQPDIHHHHHHHTLPRDGDGDGNEHPAEIEAAKHGIVYIRIDGPDNNNNNCIGTLVNGAGLAMNTVDALVDAGGRAANFLDTGGKATSETVKRSFEAILTDSRVKCIFVNIFGGLTRGDMIAEGVVLAFRDLGMAVPVVVRIRGTNEKEGQKIIADSGLPLFAFDDFDEAARKAIELANQGL